MKKTLVILAVFLCAFAVFAAKNSLNVSLVPYGFQISTSSEAAKSPVKSTYGIGAQVTYQRNLYKGLFVEGGLGWDTFLLKNKNPKAFTNLIYFGGFGYKCIFEDNWAATVNFDVAGDTLFYDKAVSESITLKTGLGVEYAFSNNFAATVKCEGTFGFAKKNGVKYVNYRILPMIGCSYNF